MSQPANSANAIEKALSVLEALADHERITDLAEMTGLPKSTVHRILQSLGGHGFATSDGNGGYLPGPRILTLAGKVMHRLDPARLAEPASPRWSTSFPCARCVPSALRSSRLPARSPLR